MPVLFWLGTFWTLYGLAGIFGMQRIPSKYKNRVWTSQYIRLCGISWLMIGIPWLLLYAVVCRYRISWAITAPLLVLLSVPSILFSIRTEKKYKAKLAGETEK